ncbi:hypothetical protein [Thermoactinomyces sp. DSM 45892]|uniref:hypothetical protein n=1 Tax=Thermoactinomyces sp. DSM 45892 TaxID=1882753 RepID=UPI00089809C2|nr:hypothetical protein [Thermoactinomyces sp. DSM 45892]SDX95452.1 hypothetical protein SAMN05444416_10194 [Thermoactinomyces sp. DSM 45892]
MALKKDLIQELVEKHGYEKSKVVDLTSAELTDLIEKEQSNDDPTKKTKSTEVDRDDLIEVMNGTSGGLKIGSSRTGYIWEFSEYGQMDSIEYHELEAMRNRNPKLFADGVLILLNDEVVKKFRMEEVYENLVTPANVEKIFEKSVEELQLFIEKIPKGMLQTLVGQAVALYRQGKLTNIQMIKFLEERFNLTFDDML